MSVAMTLPRSSCARSENAPSIVAEMPAGIAGTRTLSPVASASAAPARVIASARNCGGATALA